MLQISFGISERDVLAVLERYWEMAINPDQLTPIEFMQTAWQQMDEESMDDFANAALDAFLENQDETEAARGEIRKFLIEHHFLACSPRRRDGAPDEEAMLAQRPLPERRHHVRP